MDPIMKTLTAFILDPKNRDVLAIFKGLRNGLVYGSKIRFPHALVMTILFRDGTPREKLTSILTATKQHALNLASFVTIYKSTLYLLNYLHSRGIMQLLPPCTFLTAKTEPKYHSLIAGLLGGYLIFGRSINNPTAHAVNQQIVLYVFARVVMALAKLAVAPPSAGRNQLLSSTVVGKDVGQVAWPVFASLSWGAVMYLFRWHPETIQPSLRSSMKYLYVDSERWDGWRNFLWHNV
ncbi:peroxisomal membrane protein 24 [Terfezia boudieri ATCC MYA-4762]|uniref:Peroxisomal membrane protein 24 n=1 Tax=Terfezia boudieri ATCC MYA-4762 TaxID=1051890 RepID=A0A3N4LSX1_9PEZI|nr:peroxisomal membrane protein 24 [Terfezia boudieri ATCC MYA-4762]